MSHLSLLSARAVSKFYGDRRVLSDVSLAASPGHRLGVVGENGVGKSTVLRLLAGVEDADDGDVQRPSDCGYLTQELPYPPHTRVRAMVDDALVESRSVKTELDSLTEHIAEHPNDGAALARYGELLDWAQDHDLWNADHRAELVLAGLHLDTLPLDRQLNSLSGGQRARLGLALLLIRRPQALILDEPTNHLDDEAIEFLEQQLVRLPGAVVLASHDRVFLDQVCTAVLDLEEGREGITRYGGNYMDYLAAKQVERLRWEQQYALEQEELSELRTSVRTTARQVNHDRSATDNNKIAYDRHGGRVQRQISRRVRNAQQRLDELSENQVRRPPTPLSFRGTLTAEPTDRRVAVSLRHVEVGTRLTIDHLDITTAERLLVVGPNGAGKSTLLQVIAGHLAVDSGYVGRTKNIRIKLLAQEVEFPDPRITARQYYQDVVGPDATDLSRLGLLPPRDANRPIGVLSTGQRRRLALAVLIANPPDVLLLDEPTNHLSLTLVEELEEALRSAPGGVVVASHDRWLRREWTGTTLTLPEGDLTQLHT
ncbi:MAG: macrolide transport system ATP-binding/permease protein [Actinomycetota bacterium]|nr:macrolide transport system ATP-binding/permease protein [Actinomycetota bacterium]